MPVKLPNICDRITICGRTGTGKTVAGLWHLSNFDLRSFPWVLIDFKNDEHMDTIKNVHEADFNFCPQPSDVGLFRLRCTPYDLEVPKGAEHSRLDSVFLRIWERGNCGIFIDEAYIIGGNSEALNLIYTQGRSLRIPVITNTQRPVWCSKFAFSEASYIQVFDLTIRDDISTVEQYIPFDWDEEPPLLGHQSFYYEVAKKQLVRFAAVPPMDETAKIFNAKLPALPARRVLI